MTNKVSINRTISLGNTLSSDQLLGGSGITIGDTGLGGSDPAVEAAVVHNYPLETNLECKVHNGDEEASFSRASTKIFQNSAGEWLPAGDLATILSTYGLANKCENYTLSPTDTTGVTDGTNVTTSIYDLTAELAGNESFDQLVAAGVANGNCYRTVNSDGASARSMTITGQVGNTNPHSAGILVRADQDCTLNLNLDGTTHTSLAVTADQWTILGFANATPGGTTEQLRMVIPAGVTVDWFINSLVESDYLPGYVTVKEGTSTVDRTWVDSVSGRYVAASMQGWSEAAHTGTGTFFEGASTNKCTNYNLAPDAALTNMTLNDFGSGATLTVVDDETELRAAGLGTLIDAGMMSGNVFKVYGGDSGCVTVPTGQCGNTNNHALSAFIRVESGDARLLLTSQSGTGSPLLTNTGYERIEVTDTPALSTRQLGVQVTAGSTAYYVGNQLEEAEEVSSLMITEATTGSRALDDLQVPTYSDQFLPYSSDWDNWIKSASVTTSGQVITWDAGAASFDSIQYANLPTTAGSTYYFYVEVSNEDSNQFQLDFFDDVQSSFGNTAFNSTPDRAWYMISGTYDAGATNMRCRIKGKGAGGANEITAHRAILSTCPIRPEYLETTGTEITTATNPFPVNDCTYYINFPEGITDTGVNQWIFESQVSGTNYFDCIFITSGTAVRVRSTVGGVVTLMDVSYPGDGIPFDLTITCDSTNGKVMTLSDGTTNSRVDTTDLQIDSIMQIGNRESTASPSFFPIANFKVIDGVRTPEEARYA